MGKANLIREVLVQITVLGAHQIETATTRCYTILIDGQLAIDAGSLSSSLTLEQQGAVRAILLTHRHFDHIKDVASVGFNTIGMRTLEIYCPAALRDTLLANILNGVVWPDLSVSPSPNTPALQFFPLEVGQEAEILGYRVRALHSMHSVPTVGYLVEKDGCSAYFSSDTGPGSAASWKQIAPQLLVTEVTMPGRMAETARKTGHFTPELLEIELRDFVAARGYCPRVVITHINPLYEQEIAGELEHVARTLSARIEMATEGMRITL